MGKLLAFLLLVATTLFGADVSGTWTFQVETDAGSGSPTFVLKQSGEKLTGTYTGQLGQAEVSGTVKGDAVLIQFEVSGRKVVYTGTVDADGQKMKGKVDIGGEAAGTWTGTKK